MAKAATDFGATVLLSNHSEFDDAYFKAHTAAHRKPGQRNPFDVGANGVARNFRVVQACTSATRLSGDRGAESGARRTRFRGEAEQDSALIPNRIPG